MMINSVNQALDRTFPEPLTQRDEMSDIEKQVHNYVEKFVIKGCEYWEKCGTQLGKLGTIYRASWIPYYMLKSPFAYRNKLRENAPEKNLEVMTNITALNVGLCLMTPNVNRRIPWTALFRIDKAAHGITQLASASLLALTFIHYPAYKTLSCIKNKLTFDSQFLDSLQRASGTCLHKESTIYQGPEALLGVMTSLAVGTAAGFISHLILSIALNDTESTGRYQKLEQVYTEVAMLMKKQWDDAVAGNDKEKMHTCADQAKKLSANVPLIKQWLPFLAVLTDKQADNILSKLSWGCQYVLQQYQPATQPSNAPTKPKPDTPKEALKPEAPKQETPKQEAPKQEASPQLAPKQETPKQEVSKQVAPKQEASAQVAPKQETPKQVTPKQETQKKNLAGYSFNLLCPRLSRKP